jgi:vesicle-associated membrane protein 7
MNKKATAVRKDAQWKNRKLIIIIVVVVILVLYIIITVACGGFKWDKCV